MPANTEDGQRRFYCQPHNRKDLTVDIDYDFALTARNKALAAIKELIEIIQMIEPENYNATEDFRKSVSRAMYAIDEDILWKIYKKFPDLNDIRQYIEQTS